MFKVFKKCRMFKWFKKVQMFHKVFKGFKWF